MRKQQLGIVAIIATAACALAISARAQVTNVLVHDQWQDGNYRDTTLPTLPTYADNNGSTWSDADADGDLDRESDWFRGGGAMSIITNALDSPNILAMSNNAASSSHFYTYFTQSGTAVNLSSPGDELKLTWTFTPQGVAAQNANSGLTLALGLTPGSTPRSTNDNPLAQANYTNAFAAFMNMATTLGASSPLQLKKWSLAGSGSLAGTSGNYSSSLATGGTALSTGFVNGVSYTFTMDLDMLATGLQVTESIAGGNIGSKGTITSSSISATYLDTSLAGQSVNYDTFIIRPTSAALSANEFDTTLFEVDKIAAVPEPSTMALVLGSLGLGIGMLRRRRK